MRNFSKLLSDYKRRYKGKSEKVIKEAALIAWKVPKAEEINKRFFEAQQKMALQGLKPKTFQWVLETQRIRYETQKEFKVNIKTAWRTEFNEGGIKLIIQILLAAIIINLQEKL